MIKDGRFIGKFEEMYQKFDDPWLQKECIDDSYVRSSTVYTLKRFKVGSVAEIGCGLGFFTDYLKRSLPDVVVKGFDISETAISRARSCFPELEFGIMDIMEHDMAWGGAI